LQLNKKCTRMFLRYASILVSLPHNTNIQKELPKKGQLPRL